jgi:cbb3-type cytochrome oxidase maturation protein
MTPILVFLIGLSLLVLVALGLGIWWAIKSGQFDDLEGPAQRILMDDDDPLLPGRGREPDDLRRED